MARSKKQPEKEKRPMDINAEIAGAGTVLDQPITETLETNYMPYAMSVIVSRAIPEIDGLKPSHRKLLYSMYKSPSQSYPNLYIFTPCIFIYSHIKFL